MAGDPDVNIDAGVCYDDDPHLGISMTTLRPQRSGDWAGASRRGESGERGPDTWYTQGGYTGPGA